MKVREKGRDLESRQRIEGDSTRKRSIMIDRERDC